MINLLVDEAYAFDYLSILQVKQDQYPSQKNLKALNECLSYLEKQCDIFETVLSSEEYKNLIDINTITFNLIDILRSGRNITAKEIDDANMTRYYKKKKLQEKFFHEPLTEEKIVK